MKTFQGGHQRPAVGVVTVEAKEKLCLTHGRTLPDLGEGVVELSRSWLAKGRHLERIALVERDQCGEHATWLAAHVGKPVRRLIREEDRRRLMILLEHHSEVREGMVHGHPTLEVVGSRQVGPEASEAML